MNKNCYSYNESYYPTQLTAGFETWLPKISKTFIIANLAAHKILFDAIIYKPILIKFIVMAYK